MTTTKQECIEKMETLSNEFVIKELYKNPMFIALPKEKRLDRLQEIVDIMKEPFPETFAHTYDVDNFNLIRLTKESSDKEFADLVEKQYTSTFRNVEELD
jgi:hypothetical protein